jgi:hypothetical protein
LLARFGAQRPVLIGAQNQSHKQETDFLKKGISMTGIFLMKAVRAAGSTDQRTTTAIQSTT